MLVNSHLFFMKKTGVMLLEKWVYHSLWLFLCLIYFLGHMSTALAVRLDNLGSLKH